jgi:hypothetical protein
MEIFKMIRIEKVFIVFLKDNRQRLFFIQIVAASFSNYISYEKTYLGVS